MASHADRLGRIIAAAEFYQSPEEIDRESGAALRRSWLLVAATMLGMYLSLFVLVRRAAERARRSMKISCSASPPTSSCPTSST